MCTATTAAIAPENTFSCKYCGTQLSSRNHLYRHLREEAACGEQAVADGFDLEARRERKIHKVALLVGYTHGGSERVGEKIGFDSGEGVRGHRQTSINQVVKA